MDLDVLSRALQKYVELAQQLIPFNIPQDALNTAIATIISVIFGPPLINWAFDRQVRDVGARPDEFSGTKGVIHIGGTAITTASTYIHPLAGAAMFVTFFTAIPYFYGRAIAKRYAKQPTRQQTAQALAQARNIPKTLAPTPTREAPRQELSTGAKEGSDKKVKRSESNDKRKPAINGGKITRAAKIVARHVNTGITNLKNASTRVIAAAAKSLKKLVQKPKRTAKNSSVRTDKRSSYERTTKLQALEEMRKQEDGKRDTGVEEGTLAEVVKHVPKQALQSPVARRAKDTKNVESTALDETAPVRKGLAKGTVENMDKMPVRAGTTKGERESQKKTTEKKYVVKGASGGKEVRKAMIFDLLKGIMGQAGKKGTNKDTGPKIRIEEIKIEGEAFEGEKKAQKQEKTASTPQVSKTPEEFGEQERKHLHIVDDVTLFRETVRELEEKYLKDKKMAKPVGQDLPTPTDTNIREKGVGTTQGVTPVAEIKEKIKSMVWEKSGEKIQQEIIENAHRKGGKEKNDYNKVTYERLVAEIKRIYLEEHRRALGRITWRDVRELKKNAEKEVSVLQDRIIDAARKLGDNPSRKALENAAREILGKIPAPESTPKMADETKSEKPDAHREKKIKDRHRRRRKKQGTEESEVHDTDIGDLLSEGVPEDEGDEDIAALLNDENGDEDSEGLDDISALLEG